jgi:hypothetical protein
VNLLGVGLHSYGFTRGIQTALWTYYGLQWGVVALGTVAWWRDRLLAAGAREGARLERVQASEDDGAERPARAA